MKVAVRHNGRFIQGALCLVDASINGAGVILETAVTPTIKLDLNRGFVEVNIWGILEPLEDSRED